MRRAVSALALMAFGCATAEDATVPPVLDATSDVRVDSGAPIDSAGVDSTGDSSMDGADTTAPPETSPCPAGRSLCGGVCVNTENDVDNCGDCGTKCPEGADAIRTCVARTCGTVCTGKFAKCGGTTCSINVAAHVANCGTCGNACPTGATFDATCAGEKCGQTCKAAYPSLNGHCTNMGGVFETHAATCSAGCNNTNPYSSSCGCPAGFAPGPALPTRNDGCAVVRDANVQFCEASGAPAGVWGGAYAIEDAVACATPCRVANSKTGACTCPGGYNALNLRTLVRSTSCSSVIGGHIVMCVHPTLPLDNFAGAFESDDAVPGGVGCRAPNPRTGSCACPAGFTGYPLRTIVDTSGGAIGAQIFTCLR